MPFYMGILSITVAYTDTKMYLCMSLRLKFKPYHLQDHLYYLKGQGHETRIGLKWYHWKDLDE